MHPSTGGLQIAAAVADRLQEKQGEIVRFPALLNLGRGIKQALPELRQSIRHCIEVVLWSEGSILVEQCAVVFHYERSHSAMRCCSSVKIL